MDPNIGLDHNYSKHWSETYKTDSSHAKPIKWLLPSCKSNKSTSSRLFNTNSNKSSSSDGSDDEIDVESLDEVMGPLMTGGMWSYDMQRARMNMNETGRYAAQTFTSGKVIGGNLRSENDWEEYLNRSSWSRTQTKLFNKVIKILEDDNLSRLAFQGVNNEPIARRLALDRSAAHLRRVMAEFAWEQKLTQWLHSLMITKLPASMLASYIDIIQTLRSKVPSLVERMIMPSANSSPECLNLLLKRPWEPTIVKSLLAMKQQLSDPPLILVVPGSPYISSPTMYHRKRFWTSYLGEIGKVIHLTPPESCPGMTITTYLEQLTKMVRSKIMAVKNRQPGRPIVLIGWHTASIISCHVSLVEKVSAVICLGFPMLTMNGTRGTVDDALCDNSTPTLFVVGQDADSCDIDDLEDFREKLLTNSDNYLLGIPGADDALKVSNFVKKRASVTQTMVDKLIIDYIGKFLSEVFKASRETGMWHVSSSLLSEKPYDVSRKTSFDASREERRKRGLSGELFSASKRRRLSSATTAKISEVLSSQKSGRNREGTQSPVQGVMYNLQTGSISGLTTVPTVLGKTKSGGKDASLSGKQGKASSVGRNFPRSITIDLSKETSQQLSKLNYRAANVKSLLATESQTEAAVATILGNTSSHEADNATPDPDAGSESNSSHVPVKETSPAENSSAFKRISASSSIQASNLVAAENSRNRGPETIVTLPNSVRMTIGGDLGQLSRHVAKSFSNVKFNSTLMTSKSISVPPVITKPQWSAPSSDMKAVVHQGKFNQLLSRSTSVPATHISSRSRKDERETMQATAILEQLTNRDNEDESTSAAASLIQDTLTSSRRHSYDSTALHGSLRGRGRVRTRGGLSDSRTRESLQKRRKTLNEERPHGSAVQQRRSDGHPPTKDSFVRYVMTSDMSSVLSNAAAKAAAASGKSFSTKHSGITILPEQALFSQPHKVKYAAKPSILPVYAVTPVVSKPQTGINMKNLTPLGSSVLSRGQNIAKNISSSTPTTQFPIDGKSKIFLPKKVPLKLPMSASTSNYTFVTIPTPSRAPSSGFTVRTTSTAPRITMLPSRTEMPKVAKYSVAETPKNIVSQPKPIATEAGAAGGGRIVLKERAEKSSDKKVTITLSSPSVVLQKLMGDTAADAGPNTKK